MGWNSDPEQWKNHLPGPLWQQARDMEVPQTFQEVYDDEGWREIFRQWLATEFATENLDFLEAVDRFKASGDQAEARGIYQNFVASGVVNLAGAESKALREAIGSGQNLPHTVFDDARENIRLLVQSDNFRRFKDELGDVQAAIPAPGVGAQGGGRMRSGAVHEDDPFSKPDLPEPPPPPPGEPDEDVDPNEDDGAPPEPPPGAPDEDVDPNEEYEAPPPLPPGEPDEDVDPNVPADELVWAAEEPMTEEEAAALWEPVGPEDPTDPWGIEMNGAAAESWPEEPDAWASHEAEHAVAADEGALEPYA